MKLQSTVTLSEVEGRHCEEARRSNLIVRLLRDCFVARASLLAMTLIFCLTSCSFTKSLFRSKTKTQTTESNEVSTQTHRQITEDWTQIGSKLQHRDGLLAIHFDGPALIDIRPDGSIRFSGESPTIHSSNSFTTKDTTTTSYSRSEESKADSSAVSSKHTDERSDKKVVEVDRETQKIWPILLLILFIIIALILLFRPNPLRL